MERPKLPRSAAARATRPLAACLALGLAPGLGACGDEATPPARVTVQVLLPDGLNPLAGNARLVFTFHKSDVDTFVETLAADGGTSGDLTFTYSFPEEMETSVLEVTAEDSGNNVRARGRSVPFDIVKGRVLTVGVLVLSLDQWSYAPAAMRLSVARALHGAAVVGDGGLLVAGGTTAGGVTTTVEVFDLNAWEAVPGVPDMPVPRSRFAMVALNADQTLLLGGVMASSTADMFDGPTQTWSQIPLPLDLPDIWKGPRVIDMDNASAMFLGGFDGSDAAVPLLVRGTGTEITTVADTLDRADPSVTPVRTADGLRFLLYGGNELGTMAAALLDPATGAVEEDFESPDESRTRSSAALVGNDKVIVLGGFGTDGTTLETHARILDLGCTEGPPACSRWADGGTVLSAGGFVDAVGVPIDAENGDTRAIFIGGVDASENPTDTVLVDADYPVAIRKPMRTPRSAAAVVRLPTGQIAVIGGLDAAGNPLDTIELYEPQAR
ncbi:MAG: hypothetical protein HY907_22275 [Deltaproteobacteria bacterium]|nr:hypothetical protein [Deltaproteobacteria bacterium]